MKRNIRVTLISLILLIFCSFFVGAALPCKATTYWGISSNGDASNCDDRCARICSENGYQDSFVRTATDTYCDCDCSSLSGCGYCPPEEQVGSCNGLDAFTCQEKNVIDSGEHPCVWNPQTSDCNDMVNGGKLGCSVFTASPYCREYNIALTSTTQAECTQQCSDLAQAVWGGTAVVDASQDSCCYNGNCKCEFFDFSGCNQNCDGTKTVSDCWSITDEMICQQSNELNTAGRGPQVCIWDFFHGGGSCQGNAGNIRGLATSFPCWGMTHPVTCITQGSCDYSLVPQTSQKLTVAPSEMPAYGYYVEYYNYQRDGLDFEGSVTGLVRGDSPFNHLNWANPLNLEIKRFESSVGGGSNNYCWFPVNPNPDLSGNPDPQYFTAIYRACVSAPDGDYNFAVGSDDDSWVYLDNTIVSDLGGVHPMCSTTGTVHLTPSVQNLTIFFAERHTTQSGLNFEFTTPGVTIVPWNPFNQSCPANINPPTLPVCPDGAVEPPEQCDGTNLNGQSCISLGFEGGTLSCNSTCGFDTSSCTALSSCTLTNATWNQTNAAEGSIVSLIVNGSGCDGQNISFKVKEYNISSQGDGSAIVHNQPMNATFSNGAAVGNWTAEWNADINGFDYYYFNASTGSGFITSGNTSDKLLNVSKSVDTPPTAIITSPITGSIYLAGQTILFNQTSFDPDGDNFNYIWDFGDGNNVSGTKGDTSYNTTHVYNKFGLINVGLYLDDSRGGRAYNNTSIFIFPANGKYIFANINSPTPGQVFDDIPIPFDASGSYAIQDSSGTLSCIAGNCFNPFNGIPVAQAVGWVDFTHMNFYWEFDRNTSRRGEAIFNQQFAILGNHNAVLNVTFSDAAPGISSVLFSNDNNTYVCSISGGQANWTITNDTGSYVFSSSHDCYRPGSLSESGNKITSCCPDFMACDLSSHQCISKNIFRCSDYNSTLFGGSVDAAKDACNNDTANVGIFSVNEVNGFNFCNSNQSSNATCTDYINPCGCYWNDSLGTCGPTFNVTMQCEGIINIGQCIFTAANFSNNCDSPGGVILYRSNGSWNGGIPDLGDLARDVFDSCLRGHDVTGQCPQSLMQLPFFTWINFVIVAIILVIFYLLFRGKRSKKKNRRSK